MGRYLDIARRMDSAGTVGNYEQAPGSSTSTKYEFYESTNHTTDQDLKVKTQALLDERRRQYKEACFTYARELDWPALELAPHAAGHVGPGEFMWRLYLNKAAVAQLQTVVLPELERRVEAIGSPKEATPDPA